MVMVHAGVRPMVISLTRGRSRRRDRVRGWVMTSLVTATFFAAPARAAAPSRWPRRPAPASAAVMSS